MNANNSQVVRAAFGNERAPTPEELRAEADRLERAAKEAERAAREAKVRAEQEAENRKRAAALDEVAKKLVAVIGDGFTGEIVDAFYENRRRVIVRKEGEKAVLATIEVAERRGSWHRRDGFTAVVFGGEHEPYGRGTKAHYRADKAEALNVRKMAARAIEFASERAERNAYEAERNKVERINEPLATKLLDEFGFEDYSTVVEPSTGKEGCVHLNIKAKLYDITPERARTILAALRDLGVEL